MKIMTGRKMVTELRSLCDNVQKRLWIASPYIGSWKSVRRILGTEWCTSNSISRRLITDIHETNNLDYRTFKVFYDYGKIKSLRGLHAKIYIVDDRVLLTSANLTGTGFSRRYEAGVLVSGAKGKRVIDLYDRWWEKSTDVPLDALSTIRITKPGRNIDTEGLPQLWRLPKDPGDIPSAQGRFRDYDKFREYYADLAKLYKENVQRVLPSMPLFFEIDSFLNYLYNDSIDRPSREYAKKAYRELNTEQKIQEIRKYASEFRRSVLRRKDGKDSEKYRQESSKIIHEMLKKDNILRIKKSDIEKIASQIHALNSYAINKSKFLNPKNNSVTNIRNAWNDLLHGSGPIWMRMIKCDRALKSFSWSCIQELLGYYEPEKYPVRNTNSSAGLKFFGYDVSAYN